MDVEVRENAMLESLPAVDRSTSIARWKSDQTHSRDLAKAGRPCPEAQDLGGRLQLGRGFDVVEGEPEPIALATASSSQA